MNPGRIDVVVPALPLPHGDRGRELRNRLARQAADDEDQSGSPILVRPIIQFDRRVRDVLNKMDDDRAVAFRDRDEALDKPRIGARATPKSGSEQGFQ